MDDHAQPLRAVPDEKTAVAVAEAVLSTVYGPEAVKSERPFHASLEDGVWHISGSLNCGPNCLGGSMFIAIDRKDARVSRILHGK